MKFAAIGTTVAALLAAGAIAFWPASETDKARDNGERSEERRVGEECRSRCAWGSAVCSPDPHEVRRHRYHCPCPPRRRRDRLLARVGDGQGTRQRREIGRASCRGRV